MKPSEIQIYEDQIQELKMTIKELRHTCEKQKLALEAWDDMTKGENPEYYITHIITDADPLQFQQRVDAFKKGKIIFREVYSVSTQPIMQGQQVGAISLASCLIQYVVFKEDFNAWAFQSGNGGLHKS